MELTRYKRQNIYSDTRSVMTTTQVFDASQDVDLKKIQWSEESLSLSQFVSRYPLPQLVQVGEGFHGGSDENSLSAGQVLKIHTLTTERKILCYDRREKELHIPFHTEQKVILRPENYETVYQKVADLSRAKPLPAFVEVTRGYYNVDSNVDYELSVEPGEKLEVLTDQTSLHLTRLQKKNKHMNFRTMEGVDIKIPFDCVAGFKPLIDGKVHLLSDVIPSENNSTMYPFFFEFVTDNKFHRDLGVLKCMSSYDDRLIIASCGNGNVQVVFMIPNNLEVTVKVAVGTLQNDPAYENIKSSFHNFQTIENDVQTERFSQIFRSSSEISGFTYVPKQNRPGEWEKFEDQNENSQNEQAAKRNSLIDRQNSNDVFSVQAVKTALNATLSDAENNNLLRQERKASEQTIQNGVQSPEKRFSTASVESIEVSDKDNDLVLDMSVSEICESLRTLNMEKYVELFEENQIDGKLFSTLEFEDFQELGLKRIEIKKLFSFRDGWRPKI